MSGYKLTELKIYQVRSFSEGSFLGSPAGVCLLVGEMDENFYKTAAMKINSPETAFVYKHNDIFQLRWFTPNGNEVDLCGHATLGTAWILWNKEYVASQERIIFSTRSGELSASLEDKLVLMDFPAEPVTEVKDHVNELGKLMNISPTFVGQTRFDYFIVVGSEEIVKGLTPDFTALKKVKTRGFIITAKSEHPEFDYITRFFAPLLGIDEDPVTGSAHCALGVYWGSVLKKDSLVGYQASPEGGIVRVNVCGGRVLLSGKVIEIPVPDEVKKQILSL